MFGFLVPFATLVAAGCGGGPSADESLNKALAGTGISKEPVFPLAGKITIDGQPPAGRKEPVIVMLTDPDKLDVPPINRPLTECDSQGHFEFATYTAGDGVRGGIYVITIAQFKNAKKRGYLGPDRLKNLYNDPEKNAKQAEFKIEHKSPGKKDYAFNLEIAGKEAASPGPHAVTQILDVTR
jgi:hypothetical protein